MKKFTKFMDYLTLHPSVATVAMVSILIGIAMALTRSAWPLFAVFLFPLVQSQQVMPPQEDVYQEYEQGEGEQEDDGFVSPIGFTAKI